MLKRSLLTLAISVAATLPAFAHLDPAEHGSFAAGFSHPLFGLDHILAMVAVGLWAAMQGAFADGYSTADLSKPGSGVNMISTVEFGDKVVEKLKAMPTV